MREPPGPPAKARADVAAARAAATSSDTLSAPRPPAGAETRTLPPGPSDSTAGGGRAGEDGSYQLHRSLDPSPPARGREDSDTYSPGPGDSTAGHGRAGKDSSRHFPDFPPARRRGDSDTSLRVPAIPLRAAVEPARPAAIDTDSPPLFRAAALQAAATATGTEAAAERRGHPRRPRLGPLGLGRDHSPAAIGSRRSAHGPHFTHNSSYVDSDETTATRTRRSTHRDAARLSER